MRLQVVSDLHREMDALAVHDVADQGADIVIVAGDVDRGGRGVEWAAKTWSDKPVIYVLGNHEPYGSDLATAEAACREAAAGTNIHVLERETLTIGGVRFVAATLWTDFCLFGDGARMVQARNFARYAMNDYRAIAGPEGPRLEPEETQAIHSATIEWLDGELARPHDGPTVVVTHHAPHPQSVAGRKRRVERSRLPNDIDAAFASDLSWLIERHQPALWVHGHTHTASDYRVGKTRIVNNPRGYYGEETGWDPELVVELAA